MVRVELGRNVEDDDAVGALPGAQRLWRQQRPAAVRRFRPIALSRITPPLSSLKSRGATNTRRPSRSRARPRRARPAGDRRRRHLRRHRDGNDRCCPPASCPWRPAGCLIGRAFRDRRRRRGRRLADGACAAGHRRRGLRRRAVLPLTLREQQKHKRGRDRCRGKSGSPFHDAKTIHEIARPH